MGDDRFAVLFENAPVPLGLLDREGRLSALNAQFERTFGYSRGDMRTFDDWLRRAYPDAAYRQDALARWNAAVEAARVHGGTIGPVELRIACGDGRECVVLATGFEMAEGTMAAFTDITERRRAEGEVRHYVERLEKAVRGTVQVIATMSETRDPYTHGHERRVGDLAAAIAIEMNRGDLAEGIRLAGQVHDVGKIGIPAEILSKPSRLTTIEYELVKQHVAQGYEILKDIDLPWPIAGIVLQHHERLDGSGYPAGLAGDSIMLEARILGVADTIEAMAADRPYRAGLGLEKALDEIRSARGRVYDAAAVDACLRLFHEKGYRLPA